MTKEPFCVAARTALLIDTDKGVRPCCSYGKFGQHMPGSWGIGKLSQSTSLRDIEDSATWREIAGQLDAGKLPKGCIDCIRHEVETGWSLRKNLHSPNWARGLTYLEINSSNVCTLQCRHCGPGYSHRWAKDVGGRVEAPIGDDLERHLREKDLSHLERVMFKGGEPMVNRDVLVTLRYLKRIDRLRHVHTSMVTNGSVIDDEIIGLMLESCSVGISISVDGAGAVQTYIRDGASENSRIETFIARCRDLHQAHGGWPYFGVQPLVSVMAYNVASLPAIAEWWKGIGAQGALAMLPLSFKHFVLDPPWLSTQVLSDARRAELAARYEALDPELYSNVIRVLRGGYAGDALHEEFVRKTRETDALLGRKLEECIPDLVPELAPRG